jgi:NAD(P)-dependent dehydrogenase (short-subunit alcohol dehydrogenase family)
MSLNDKNVVVTGGSRGLGLGLVEALVARGARVTVVARDAKSLEAVHARLGVATVSADVADETAAHRILAEVCPDILVLNAGATPRMGRLDQLSWADFTAPWETDVKAGLFWLQAALNLPLNPGSRDPRPMAPADGLGRKPRGPFSPAGTTSRPSRSQDGRLGRRGAAVESSPIVSCVTRLGCR